MEYSALMAGDVSPIVSLPVADTYATAYLCGEGLIVSIYAVSGTGFDCNAVSDGQIEIAIEKEGPMAFLLLRFKTLIQTAYLMTPFDALNTPSKSSFERVMSQFSSSDGVALRIWTQNESGIIQTIRHSKLPASLQCALKPIVRRQIRGGKRFDFHRSSELMRRFMARSGRPSVAFDQAEIRGRVS